MQENRLGDPKFKILGHFWASSFDYDFDFTQSQCLQVYFQNFPLFPICSHVYGSLCKAYCLYNRSVVYTRKGFAELVAPSMLHMWWMIALTGIVYIMTDMDSHAINISTTDRMVWRCGIDKEWWSQHRHHTERLSSFKRAKSFVMLETV